MKKHSNLQKEDLGKQEISETRAPQISAESISATPSRSGSGKVKIIVGVVAGVVAISAVVAGCVFFGKDKSPFEKKYHVLNSDGTAVELTEEELRTSLSGDVFYQGVKIDGIDVSGKTKEEAVKLVAATVSEKPSEVNIKLSYDGTDYPLDISTLSLENNAQEIVDEAFSYARPAADATPEQLVECYGQMQGLKTNAKEYNTAFTVKTDGLSEIIHGMFDEYDKEVIEATVGDFNIDTLEFDISESQEGCDVNIEKAIEDTKALLDSGTYEGVVTVDFEIKEPEFSSEELKSQYGMISSSESITTSDSNRNSNINTACEKLDGLIIQPGEQFSFNGYVGRRTVEAGYKTAGVIIGGKAEKGIGGGVCQVSSMMFQSAAKANLQIDERHCHEWPSTYCPIGTDATVDYGSADLRFTNNTEYPIAVHAFYVDEETKVTIQFYGHLFEDGKYIDLVSSGGYTGEDAGVKYEADPEVEVGTVYHSHPAHNPQSAVCYKVWYDKDGNEIEREKLCYSYYPPIPAYVDVGILNPDGSLAVMDPETGEIIGGTMDESSDSSDSSGDTTPSSSSDTTPSSSDTTPSAATPTPTPEPTPAEPTPAEPTPAEPTPAEPTPAEPTPAEPTPADPTPAEQQTGE